LTPRLPQGKVALAKMQAGDYDEAAVKAKLEGLITGKPVRPNESFEMTTRTPEQTGHPARGRAST
jgi:hypothetical protein